MRKFYQKSWFDIDFKSFTELDSKRIVNMAFYDHFYDEFYKRYSSYDNLPAEWKHTQEMVADHILQQTNNKEQILSIGCGNGYIENLLSKEGRNITVVEPSVKATRFLKTINNVKILQGYFPNCLDKKAGANFDFAFLRGAEYFFQDDELIGLLKSAKGLHINHFIVITGSLDRLTYMQSIKEILRDILSFLYIRHRGQLWGYLRNPDEFIKIFKESGYKKIETGFLKENIFWIRGCIL